MKNQQPKNNNTYLMFIIKNVQMLRNMKMSHFFQFHINDISNNMYENIVIVFIICRLHKYLKLQIDISGLMLN